jgi:hypothetical protein
MECGALGLGMIFFLHRGDAEMERKYKDLGIIF